MQIAPETAAVLTVAEACERLRVKRPALYQLIRRGDLRAARLGSGPKARIRVPASEVERILAPAAARGKA